MPALLEDSGSKKGRHYQQTVIGIEERILFLGKEGERE